MPGLGGLSESDSIADAHVWIPIRSRRIDAARSFIPEGTVTVAVYFHAKDDGHRETPQRGDRGRGGGDVHAYGLHNKGKKNDLSLVTQGRVPGGEEERAMCTTTMGLAGALLCLY